MSASFFFLSLSLIPSSSSSTPSLSVSSSYSSPSNSHYYLLLVPFFLCHLTPLSSSSPFFFSFSSHFLCFPFIAPSASTFPHSLFLLLHSKVPQFCLPPPCLIPPFCFFLFNPLLALFFSFRLFFVLLIATARRTLASLKHLDLSRKGWVGEAVNFA